MKAWKRVYDGVSVQLRTLIFSSVTVVVLYNYIKLVDSENLE